MEEVPFSYTTKKTLLPKILGKFGKYTSCTHFHTDILSRWLETSFTFEPITVEYKRAVPYNAEGVWNKTEKGYSYTHQVEIIKEEQEWLYIALRLYNYTPASNTTQMVYVHGGFKPYEPRILQSSTISDDKYAKFGKISNTNC